MSFKIGYCFNAKARAAISPLQGQHLTVTLGPGDAACAVRRYAPTSYQRMNPASPGYGISVAHQNDKATPLAGQEPGRALVIDEHGPLRKGSGFGKTDELKRIDTEIDATGQCNVEVPGDQCRT